MIFSDFYDGVGNYFFKIVIPAKKKKIRRIHFTSIFEWQEMEVLEIFDLRAKQLVSLKYLAMVILPNFYNSTWEESVKELEIQRTCWVNGFECSLRCHHSSLVHLLFCRFSSDHFFVFLQWASNTHKHTHTPNIYAHYFLYSVQWLFLGYLDDKYTFCR